MLGNLLKVFGSVISYTPRAFMRHEAIQTQAPDAQIQCNMLLQKGHLSIRGKDLVAVYARASVMTQRAVANNTYCGTMTGSMIVLYIH